MDTLLFNEYNLLPLIFVLNGKSCNVGLVGMNHGLGVVRVGGKGRVQLVPLLSENIFDRFLLLILIVEILELHLDLFKVEAATPPAPPLLLAFIFKIDLNFFDF